MREFFARVASRLPQTWLGRAVWLMLGIAIFWGVYRFGFFYARCRINGSEKITCVVDAVSSLYIEVWIRVTGAATRILTLILW